MSLENISNILILIFTFVGTCGTGFLVWKACQKPKAILHLADGTDEATFTTHYYRPIAHKYYTDPLTNCYASHQYSDLVEKYNNLHEKDNEFILSFCLENFGSLQLENYRVDIEWRAGIQSIGYINCKPRRIIGNTIEPMEPDDLTINRGKPQITYAPLDKLPLNQNDQKQFGFRFTPHPDAEEIELIWHIKAKDFSNSGKIIIHLEPNITEYTEIRFANCERDIPEGEEKVDDLTPYIKEFEELLKE